MREAGFESRNFNPTACIVSLYFTHLSETILYPLSVLHQFTLEFFLLNNITEKKKKNVHLVYGKKNVHLVFWEIILAKIKVMVKHAKLMIFWKVNMTQIGIKLKIKYKATLQILLKAQWPIIILSALTKL